MGGVISSDMSRAIAARSRAPGTEIHAVTAQRWKKTEPRVIGVVFNYHMLDNTCPSLQIDD